jgi:hypothetical protein
METSYVSIFITCFYDIGYLLSYVEFGKALLTCGYYTNVFESNAR